MQPTNSNVELNDLMFMTLDHGFESISVSGGPLVPFVIYISDDDKKLLERFIEDKLEKSIYKAKEFIDQNLMKMKKYSFAYDGFVTVDSHKFSAVIVEANDIISKDTLSIAQRYVNKGLFKKKVKKVGNPILLK